MIHLRSAGWLIFATHYGNPLRLWQFTAVEEAVVNSILAFDIIGFSAYCMRKSHTFELTNDRLAWLFGFCAGVLGGAYGMNGPPLVIYGSLRRWTPEHFRATLQAYFLPASLLGMCGYCFAGLWTREVTLDFFWSLPGAVVAIFLRSAPINRHACIAGRFCVTSMSG